MTSAPPRTGPPAVASLGALRAPLAVAAAAAAGTAYVGAVDPGDAGHYPGCPLLAATGLYCPFCGSLRAVHALAHRDVAAATGLNALTIAGVAVLVGLWLRWVVRSTGGRPATVALPRWVAPALLGVAVVFGLVRNLPFGSGLAP